MVGCDIHLDIIFKCNEGVLWGITLLELASHRHKKADGSKNPPALIGNVCGQIAVCLCLRRMRKVLMPNGSRSIAPATTVEGSGTAETEADEMLPE